MGSSTNGDTALLGFLIDLSRSGLYDSADASFRTANRGWFYLRNKLSSNKMSGLLLFGAGGFTPSDNTDGRYGLSVRCDNPSSIFSPEAMGWLRGVM